MVYLTAVLLGRRVMAATRADSLVGAITGER